MRELINRKKLTSLLSEDLLGESLKGFHFKEIQSAVPDAIASALHQCHRDHTSIDRYACYRQLEAVYKKACPPDGTVSNSLKDQAILSFFELEDVNRNSNKYIDSMELFHAKRLNMAIDLVHSYFPPLAEVWEDVWPLCDFGPGASFSSRGPLDSHVLSKISGPHSVTESCHELAQDVISTFFPAWFSTQGMKGLDIVEGNRLAFVPKDKDKCRTIAIEPSLNMFLQKGVGEWMLRRLKKCFGINLRDQSRNVFLARKGSIHGSLATIDLSDASSRLPRSLMKLLLPRDWFVLLDTIRSHKGYVNGAWHRYEMFSSQGNAFTFPLETLVFYALSTAVHSDLDSKFKPVVYGDDLIIDSKLFFEVSDLLEEVGSKVNYLKSFHDGLFRESCGGDFVLGHNVRPIYYKSDAVRYSDVAKIHNLLFERWGNRIPKTLTYLRSLVPKDKILMGPRTQISSNSNNFFENTESISYDSWFWMSYFEPEWKWDRCIQDFKCKLKAWTVVPRKNTRQYHDDIVWRAYFHSGSEVRESSRLVSHRVSTVQLYLSSVKC